MDAHPFTLVWPQLLSLSLFNYLASSTSGVLLFFCIVTFPQLFQLFDRYLGVVTGENNAFCCFVCAVVDSLLICSVIHPFEPTGRPSSIVKVRFLGNQSTRMVSFFAAIMLYSRYFTTLKHKVHCKCQIKSCQIHF